MEILLSLSIGMLVSLLITRLVKPLGFPAVTAYLIAGIIVGPYVLGRLGISGVGFSDTLVDKFSIISDVALGFIAFSIGNECRLDDLKHTGKQTAVIGVIQAVVATITVDIVLIAVTFIPGVPLTLSGAITLGAIAAATAPATTLMVVHQYKAHGPITNVLLPVVALDDAVGLIIFAVSFGIAKAIDEGTLSLISILVNPIIEIVLSLTLGFLTGLLLHVLEKRFNSGSKRLSLAVAFVLLSVALAKMKFQLGELSISFSPLLVCMMLGSTFCNINTFSADIMEKAEKWTAPIYIVFFVLSGASLEFDVFSDVAFIGIGLVYVLARSFGKIYGAKWSSSWVHADPNIRKYLGITLLPQEGVALGMSLMAMQLSGNVGITVRSITLFAVLIYELVSPMLTKISLQKAGEITTKVVKISHSEDS